MIGWMRYPGRVAHLIDSAPEPIMGPDVHYPAVQLRVGSAWRSACNRTLRIFWPERPWSASWVDPLELRLEVPRGWCLRCGYHAALTALALPTRSGREFERAIERGARLRLS